MEIFFVEEKEIAYVVLFEVKLTPVGNYLIKKDQNDNPHKFKHPEEEFLVKYARILKSSEIPEIFKKRVRGSTILEISKEDGKKIQKLENKPYVYLKGDLSKIEREKGSRNYIYYYEVLLYHLGEEIF